MNTVDDGTMVLCELYDDIGIPKRMKRQRLRRLGFVERLDEGTLALKVFDAVYSGGTKGRRRSLLLLKDQV